MNLSTQKKIAKLKQNAIIVECGVIFKNTDTGQTFFILDSGNKTDFIDLHPSEYFELLEKQKQEDLHWKKITKKLKILKK